MTVQCLILGLTCSVHYLNLPEQNLDHKTDTARGIYNKILVQFNDNAKKSGALTGGYTLIIWLLFGFFPVWLQTYCAAPKYDSPDMISLGDRFGLHWLNDTESAPFVCGLQKALSAHLGYPIDIQYVNFIVCKLGRVI